MLLVRQWRQVCVMTTVVTILLMRFSFSLYYELLLLRRAHLATLHTTCSTLIHTHAHTFYKCLYGDKMSQNSYIHPAVSQIGFQALFLRRCCRHYLYLSKYCASKRARFRSINSIMLVSKPILVPAHRSTCLFSLL